MELKTTEQKVAYLLDEVPAARMNYKLLLLLYWQVFDNIEIPQTIVNAILADGTEPESISRLKRKALSIDIDVEEVVNDFRKSMEEELGNGKGNS